MMRGVLLIIGLGMLASNSQAGELYRWVDSSGIVHYTDIPPPKSVQAETKKFSSSAGPDEALPYETRRAQQNFPVTLYVADGCDEACNQARSLLDKRGIPFNVKLLKTTEDINAFKALSGFNAVPALSVGRNFLRGFQAEQWHSELDIAGYPKIAPYRPAVKPSAPAAASQVEPANPSAQ